MLDKSLHYKNYQANYRVECLSVDITRHVLNISPISTSLDNEVVGEYAVSNTTIALNNTTDLFATSNPSNFFVNNGSTITGFRAEVKIYIGFVVSGTLQEQLILDGEIDNVDQNVKGDIATLRITDKTQRIRNEEASSIGLEKSLTIPITNENQAVLQEAVRPLSSGSDVVRATIRSTLTTLTRKDNIRSEGVQSPMNYQVNDDGIEIEGEPDYTEIQLRADFPYRHKRVETLIKELLDSYGISSTRIDIGDDNAEYVRANHISSYGRVGYDTDSSVRDLIGDWMFEGYVTDMLYNRNTDEYYFLYSSRSRETRPQIIKYNVANDEYSIVFKATSNYEFWKFATHDFNTFYILLTTPAFTGGFPDLGTYDTSEVATSPVAIGTYNVTTSTFDADFIDRTHTYRPQLAHNIFFGNDIFRTHRVPDSRRNMVATSSTVYYGWATSTGFGVSDHRDNNIANAAVDSYNNNTGFDFVIDGTSCFVGSTSVNPATSESTLYVHQYTIS